MKEKSGLSIFLNINKEYSQIERAEIKEENGTNLKIKCHG